MTQEAQKLTDQAGTWFYAVERHDDDGFVASGWTELFTESGDIGIIIVDVNARNVWDDCKMENAKCRALASWNALAGIPIEAIESGVVAELIEALRRIRDMKPREYTGPEFDSEASAACPDCIKYQGHPIQQGICDEHRRPFYTRQDHDKFEEQAKGSRCYLIASTALAKLEASK